MEALILPVIPMIALAVYLVARFQGYGEPKSRQEAIEGLRQQLAWHEQRLQHAREKNWDREMVHRITEDLDDTRFALARLNAAQTSASPRNPAS